MKPFLNHPSHVSGQVQRSGCWAVTRTSMYRFPMWCLCLCRARSLCSSLTNLTSASPFLLPWAFRQRAAPPLWRKQNRGQEGGEDTRQKTRYSSGVGWNKERPTWRYWVLWRTWRCLDPKTARASLAPSRLCCRQWAPSCCCEPNTTSCSIVDAKQAMWWRRRPASL